jgi:hypothetical protein
MARKQIKLSVSPQIYAEIEAMALKQGVAVATYANKLVQAALNNTSQPAQASNQTLEADSDEDLIFLNDILSEDEIDDEPEAQGLKINTNGDLKSIGGSPRWKAKNVTININL